MSPRAVAWLERAFLDGNADNFRVLLQGRLNQMPFDQGQGTFEARFDFADVSLDYHPTWGQLDELEGNAVFSGRSMKIKGRNARILESPVKGVVASIEDLQQPVLTIDGTVGGTLAAMLDYVQSSPLKKNFGSLVEQLDASGDAHLLLNLRIPLKDRLGSMSLKGDVTFSDNTLALKNDGIELDDIDGAMNFTLDGISIKKASASLLGQPVELAVYKQGVEGNSQTVVDVQGRFGLTDYLSREKTVFSGYLEGRAPWRILLEIQNQVTKNVPRVALELVSDLDGASVNLPAPFSKTASEKRKLSIRWVPDSASRQPLQISYADVLDAQLLLDDQKHLRRAGVRLGGEKARLPLVDGIHLSGNVETFDLGQWLPILTRSGNGGSGLQPAIDMEAGLFIYAGFQVADVRVRSKLADPWHFQVDGADSQGWLRWLPAERLLPARLLTKFELLNMHGVSGQPVSESDSGEKLSPTAMPELDIEVSKLHLDDRELGAISLRSRRVNQGTSFDQLSIRSAAIVLEGSGAWLEQNNAQVSHFSVSITGGELGELTKLLKSGNEVKGGKLSGDMTLSWPGGPADFELAQVEADIYLNAKDGRLLSVDEGGAGKLLSLFSLNSLQRRLSLDFTDVVKEGFTFDNMEGHFVVMEGNAFTNDFTIEGTSAIIDIAGRTGLITQDYDQLVTVTPQVSSTLPIAGAIAGGPVVGAAVFLADKLVGDKFNRITRVRYKVSGSWDDPVYRAPGAKEPGGNHVEIDVEDIHSDGVQLGRYSPSSVLCSAYESTGLFVGCC